ncbi:MAG: DNA mismatch repair protein MutS, partial [Pedobacter sp.]
NSDLLTTLAGILLFIPVAIFIIVVKKQTKILNLLTEKESLLWVYKNELTVLADGQNGYSHGEEFEDELHPYTSDLDIFGTYSLYALVNRNVTKVGKNVLAKSLAQPSYKPEILERQDAIKEILNHVDDTFGFRAKLRNHNVEQIEQIKNRLSGPLATQLAFTKNTVLRIYVKALPFIMCAMFLTGFFFGDVVWGILGILLFVHAGLSFYFSKHINQVYHGFSGGANLLSAYAEAIKWTEEKDWKSNYIKQLFSSSHKVSEDIKGLVSIIQAFDARLNIIVGAVLNFLLLWDLRCSIRLDEWHERASSHIENGLDRIGYFEELISFATFASNYPNYTFPVISDEYTLEGKSIGHPLIAKQKRVDNDYDIGISPAVNIVTGSNMAGKSTFLRTIGINMVLAYAGAPACAADMKLSIFSVNTYMRIKDSLNESTSTFKAELNRLKMILNHVSLQEHPLVLIDEMLRGTNSHDKYMGSKAFIEKMISSATPTLFATHDLSLSELEEIHGTKVANYHFDIQIENGEMNFDYKLKNGPCTIFNAAILLKEIGLTST